MPTPITHICFALLCLYLIEYSTILEYSTDTGHEVAVNSLNGK